MRDHMRGVIVPWLGPMHLLTDPGQASLQTIARLQSIGEWSNRGAGGTSPSCRPRGGVVRPIIWLDPDAAQDIHRGLGPHWSVR
jgi:hypothetical protein